MELLSTFIVWLSPAVCSRDITMYLVLSAFTSSPISLVATTTCRAYEHHVQNTGSHNINHEVENVGAGVNKSWLQVRFPFPSSAHFFLFFFFSLLSLPTPFFFPWLFRPLFLPSSLANPVLAPTVLKDVSCLINTLKAKKRESTFKSNPPRSTKEHCFQDCYQTAPACRNGKSVNNVKMNMRHWMTDTIKGIPNYLDKNQFQCHFVHHTSHTHWPGIKPAPTCWKTKINLVSTLHLGYRNKSVNAVEVNYYSLFSRSTQNAAARSVGRT